MEFKRDPQRGLTVINDAYNASPASMQAALHVLADTARGGRSIAVLGDMYELGAYTEAGHFLVGETAKTLGISYLITVGEWGALIARGALQAGMDAAKIRSCHSKEKL